MSKGFALHLVLRQKLESTRKWLKLHTNTANHKLQQYARAFRYLLLSVKEPTAALGTKLHTTLWLKTWLKCDITEVDQKKILFKEDRGIVFTCAANSIPRIPWLAGAHKGPFSVLPISVCTTVVLSCFTLIYICKKEVRH